MKVIVGVCNYVIFLANIFILANNSVHGWHRFGMAPKYVCGIIKNFKIRVWNHQKFVCRIIKIAIF